VPFTIITFYITGHWYELKCFLHDRYFHIRLHVVNEARSQPIVFLEQATRIMLVNNQDSNTPALMSKEICFITPTIGACAIYFFTMEPRPVI